MIRVFAHVKGLLNGTVLIAYHTPNDKKSVQITCDRDYN